MALLRQYFPKGTDLSRWSAEEIEAVAHASTPDPAKPSAGRHRPKPSTNTYDRSNKPVLRPPIESGLRSAIGVEYGTGQTTPHRVSGCECVGDEFGAHVVSDRVPDHPPRKQSMTVARYKLPPVASGR